MKTNFPRLCFLFVYPNYPNHPNHPNYTNYPNHLGLFQTISYTAVCSKKMLPGRRTIWQWVDMGQLMPDQCSVESVVYRVQCTEGSEQCVFFVHYAVCSLQYALYSGKFYYAVCSVEDSELYVMSRVQSTAVCSLHWAVCSVLLTVYTMQYAVCTLNFTVRYLQLQGALCGVQCSVYSI